MSLTLSTAATEALTSVIQNTQSNVLNTDAVQQFIERVQVQVPDEDLGERLGIKAKLEKNETKPTKPTKETTVDGATVDLLQDYVRIHLPNNLFKCISYVDFFSMLGNILNTEEAEKKNNIFWVPQHTFYFAMGTTGIDITMYYPECKREINYLGNVRLSLVPNIVISHSLKRSSGQKYNVITTKYFCTNKSIQELTRKFYISTNDSNVSVMPFTNCYNSAELCFGSNAKLKDITLPDLRPLHSYYEVLFNSPFNNDLGLVALKTGSKYLSNYLSWYQYLARCATENLPFPYTELRAFSK